MKKHYLLVWPTHRKDWVAVFYDLKKEFDFTFLPSAFPSESNHAEDFPCKYWHEFQDADSILDEIEPDGVIFMSVDSGLSMILNHVTQLRNIPTFILQHGIYTNYKDYRTRERFWNKQEKAAAVAVQKKGEGFSTLNFARNSLKGFDKFKLLWIAVFTFFQKNKGEYWAAKYLPLRVKKVDYYLCLSPYNSTIHRETDRISDHHIRYIGSSELIGYLKKEEDLINDSFYLHIDQAMAQNSMGEETLSREEMISFYLKLNEFVKSKDARLYIKLHPESYFSDWLPEDDNITYLRKVDNFNAVIQSANGCFGFYSTLVVPAVYWKPTILFSIFYSGLQEALAKVGEIQILDFRTFETSDIEFKSTSDKEMIKETFILPKSVNEESLVDVLRNPEYQL
ncbi:polysialyltransferase family glycosyltransferase [Roseivirga sp.]|uniref:polysialyltransferase family glycosyltransferase n=1 Tax=Roseivirga sp. TaxID=1964215 RepID=UPI003B8B3E67